jgi:hypothetical protein
MISPPVITNIVGHSFDYLGTVHVTSHGPSTTSEAASAETVKGRSGMG